MKSIGSVCLIATFMVLQVSGKRINQRKPTIYQVLFDRMHQHVDEDKHYINREQESSVETKWIEQKLDNFDENNAETWQRRYMINQENYQLGGPLFIYVGGESAIRATSISGARHIVKLAEEHNGCVLYPEHRYYGESNPTPDLSTDYLKYLDVRQALADLADFILFMKETIPGAKNSSVILVGGSYPASMATWFKKVYPEMAVGSWASSGPLLAKTDFFEYKEVVGQSILNVGGNECYGRINNSFHQLQKMFQNKRLAVAKSVFKICDNFNDTNELDVWNFFNVVAETFSSVVQYAESGDIEKTCKYFNGVKSDYINLASFFLSYIPTESCHDMTYNAMIQSLSYTSYEGGASRQWTYQTCNEFGWFQTSTSRNQPFGSLFPLDFFLQICEDLFGVKFLPKFIEHQVAATNAHFNGFAPDAKNVYYTQGALDPWSSMGIRNNVIPLESHCADLRTPKVNDSTLLLASRAQASKLIRKWINCDRYNSLAK